MLPLSYFSCSTYSNGLHAVYLMKTLYYKHEIVADDDNDDHFYIVLFSALKQTDCAFVTCHSKWGTTFSMHVLNIHRSGVLKRFLVTWLVPHETATVLAFCSECTTWPCTMSHHFMPCHFMQSHIYICRVHVYLAVTCHLHFWQKDRDLFIATGSTAVKRGSNRYQNKSQHKKLTIEKKILQLFLSVVCPRSLPVILSWRWIHFSLLKKN